MYPRMKFCTYDTNRTINIQKTKSPPPLSGPRVLFPLFSSGFSILFHSSLASFSSSRPLSVIRLSVAAVEEIPPLFFPPFCACPNDVNPFPPRTHSAYLHPAGRGRTENCVSRRCEPVLLCFRPLNMSIHAYGKNRREATSIFLSPSLFQGPFPLPSPQWAHTADGGQRGPSDPPLSAHLFVFRVSLVASSKRPNDGGGRLQRDK